MYIDYIAAKEKRVVFLKEDDKDIYFLCEDEKYKKLDIETKKNVQYVIDKRYNFKRVLEETYSIENTDEDIKNQISKVSNNAEDLFTYIIEKSVEMMTSDIHISIDNNNIKVKFRIDSVLRTFCILDKREGDGFVRILKIKSKIDISKTVKPLEGRFQTEIAGKKVDFRVSILPKLFGEKIDIRILGNHLDIYDFDDIALEEDQKEIIERNIKKNQGFILVTGPTGSGKSTTLFTILHYLNDGTKNIISIEDPVEYILDGVTQISIQKSGMDFHSALKFILRQDPEIIYIGEMRDKVTAQMALSASETGHMVFSTLHTLDTISTIERLTDLGGELNKISASISLIISQRLVRVLCDKCKKEYDYPEYKKEALGIDKNAKLYKAQGCKHCYNTGYKGRKAVFEILEVNDEIRPLIKSYDIEKLNSKIVTLKQSIISMIEDGVTSIEEGYKYI